MRHTIKAGLLSFMAFAAAGCRKSDPYTGTFVGGSTMIILGRGAKAETKKADVTTMLEGNRRKDILLHLAFGKNSPLRGCRLPVASDVYKDPTAPDTLRPFIEVTNQDQIGTGGQTCTFDVDGVPKKATVHKMGVLSSEGVLEMSLDATLTDTRESLTYKFVGGTTPGAIAKRQARFDANDPAKRK